MNDYQSYRRTSVEGGSAGQAAVTRHKHRTGPCAQYNRSWRGWWLWQKQGPEGSLLSRIICSASSQRPDGIS